MGVSLYLPLFSRFVQKTTHGPDDRSHGPSVKVKVCLGLVRGVRLRSRSLAVFGNGRTHTGELEGSGGSRLANYRSGSKLRHRGGNQNVPVLLSKSPGSYSE